MQPNSNRPVYIVQPSNITSLNVRPTIITTGAQQLQTQQQPVYQISTIRQPVISPPQHQQSPMYQVQGQPRLVSATPVYTSLPTTQRFATSPQTLLQGNTNISPRLLTSQTAPRVPVNPGQPTTSLMRPGTTTISSPTVSTIAAASTAAAAAAAASSTASSSAPGSKEFSVRLPKTRAQYGVMEFTSGLSLDVKDWKNLEMRREITSYNYRPASNPDPNASSSNTITTSLGVVLPKTGAGSEYGREQKEALKRKRYATKGTNLEDLPWILTDRSSSDKKIKQYRGQKRGSITANCSYYVFIQGKDGFEAYPVDDWYSFTPTNVYKTLDFDEAEKQFQDRHKNLSKWFLNHQVTKEKEPGDEGEGEGGKKSAGKAKREFKLLDAEDWINEKEEDEEDDDDDDGDDGGDDKSKKKSKNKKNSKNVKGAWTLSDEDDDDDANESKAKKQKKTKRQTSEDQGGEDSDDGDHEGDEIEYTSDETSTDEDDIRDVNTAKSAEKYEVKGVDEEVKNMPDIEKKLEQMDENGDELDLDEDEEFTDIEDNDNEDKTAVDDLSDVTKLLKNDPLSKDIETSSDSDDMDDSDDPDKESIEQTNNAVNLQPIPSEQIKTEKGHKKAREEEMRAIKSKVMSLPATPSNPTEAITEDKVRSLLLRKEYMTFTEIIQHFVPKSENLRTKEVKDAIVHTLAAILKRLNIEEKTKNGKKHIRLK